MEPGATRLRSPPDNVGHDTVVEGGGITRVLQSGSVFEKAGVNVGSGHDDESVVGAAAKSGRGWARRAYQLHPG